MSELNVSIIEANKAIIEAAVALKQNADKLAAILAKCDEAQIRTLMATNPGMLSRIILGIVADASVPLSRLLSIERVLNAWINPSRES
ncbi:hypothetical protein F-LCD7_0217 [Faustovirus]|nr:hypothetical protein F-LCD7_0217 [Faustovirus]